MLRCDAAKVGLLTVLAKPMTHDTNLIIIHRHGHRGRQPGRRLRRDQRAVPESRVELGEIGEAAGDAVYAGMLGAVTEFAAAIDQVFQHDEALARAIVVPVRVIAGRGLRGQLVREKVIEAGFERMDVDIVELETPVGLEDRKSEEHTSELQSLMRISYAVFCLKKKTITT